MTKEALKLALEDYLSREMPAGTVIGDPKWWAAKIANVMTGKAVAEVYKQGYDHGVERQEAIQKLSEIEKQTPASKNQWWAKELEGFWGDSDYRVTLDTRRAAKTALTVIFDNSQPKQEQGEQWQKGQQALDKKADNARELGLDYEPENTLHWHALNYRTAPTQNAQAMFEALEKFVAKKEQEAPKGYKLVMVPKESPTDEPDWDECIRQAEVSTGLKVERNTLSIVIREVRRWLIAKQEQGESVAYLNPDDVFADTAFRWCKIDEFTQPVYTTPQPAQKPWVGLTDDEISEAYNAASKKALYAMGATREDVYEAIEAKLKEKNT